jgi:hypothetical protein
MYKVPSRVRATTVRGNTVSIKYYECLYSYALGKNEERVANACETNTVLKMNVKINGQVE